jgi:7-cyano-7-deazaguanine synthase
MQLALNGGMARQFALHTPLMWVSKAETWAIAESLGGAALVEVVRVRTHTCYLGDRTQLHSWGYGCGMCPACELRKLGHLNWLKNCNSVEASAGEL